MRQLYCYQLRITATQFFQQPRSAMACVLRQPSTSRVLAVYCARGRAGRGEGQTVPSSSLGPCRGGGREIERRRRAKHSAGGDRVRTSTSNQACHLDANRSWMSATRELQPKLAAMMVRQDRVMVIGEHRRPAGTTNRHRRRRCIRPC